MNKTQITLITLINISLLFTWYNTYNNNKHTNALESEISVLNQKISDLETDLNDNKINNEKWKALATYILNVDERLVNLIETHDSNVELYNRQIRENTRAINDVIDYLK